MKTAVLDQVLASAAALPVDQQEMLEDLLSKRRIEAWRRETATEARSAARALRSGKLKPQPVEDVIARLRSGLVIEAD
jgi:hypothetical protein